MVGLTLYIPIEDFDLISQGRWRQSHYDVNVLTLDYYIITILTLDGP